MKTTACLLVSVAALMGGLHAQSAKVNTAHGRQNDPTIGPIVPFDRLTPKNQGETLGPLDPGKPPIPLEAMELAQKAREQFERGDFTEAEKTYDKALAKVPDNLYLLSNKAVVLLREQKYQFAEEAFKQAIAVAPEDDFSHCTLGIVEYQQGKLDEAINELTKALAIDPKNATAHNYLGITASQKEWPAAAQKELELAVSLDPAYADAEFNLAIVLATQTPPNKEAARAHYQRAIKLGATPDAQLEQLMK